MTFYEKLYKKYEVNKPILLEDLKKKFRNEKNIVKKINYLVKKDKVKRFEKGIYYIPEYVMLGKNKLEVGLDVYEVIDAKYIKNNTIGYLAGANLKYMLGLSTQVPIKYEIVTNNVKKDVEKIKIKNIDITLRKSKVKITKNNVKTLMILELISSLKEEELFGDDSRRNNKIIKDYFKKENITEKQFNKYIKYFKTL